METISILLILSAIVLIYLFLKLTKFVFKAIILGILLAILYYFLIKWLFFLERKPSGKKDIRKNLQQKRTFRKPFGKKIKKLKEKKEKINYNT